MLGALLLALTVASPDREIGFLGAEPAKARIDEPAARLYGPFEVEPSMRRAEVVMLLLSGVRFDPERAGSAEVYVIDADKPLRLDRRAYVGSVAGMVGMPASINRVVELNDFEVEGVKYTARSTLREARRIYLVVVTRSGSVSFERGTLSSRLP